MQNCLGIKLFETPLVMSWNHLPSFLNPISCSRPLFSDTQDAMIMSSIKFLPTGSRFGVLTITSVTT